MQVSGVDVRRSPSMKFRNARIALVYEGRAPADLCGDTVKKGPNPPPTLPWREQLLFAYRHRLGGTTPYDVNHSLYGYYTRFWKDPDAKPEPAFEQYHPEYFCAGV